jgi:hypothetical protein
LKDKNDKKNARNAALITLRMMALKTERNDTNV